MNKEIKNIVPKLEYKPMEIEFSLEEKLKIYFDKFKFIMRISPNLIAITFKLSQLINIIQKKGEFTMTQSTLDTITGIVRAVLVVAGILIGKDLPVNEIITTLLPIITGIWALYELIKGIFSNSSKITKEP